MAAEDENNIDISDDELEEKIQEKKRHSELLKAIKGVAASFKKDDNKELVEVISKMSDLIKSFPHKIQVNNTQPNINVETNQDKVVNSLKEVKDALDKLTESIKIKPTEWDFKIIRNNYGNIQSITAKAIK